MRKRIEVGIAARRRSPAARFAAKVARWYLRSYDNFDYETDSNGERWLVEQVVVPGSVVVDVGANIGDWSVMVHDHDRLAEIHAFEIVPSTAQLLRRRLGSDVIINEFGLLDRNGSVDVHFTPSFSAVSSILPGLHDEHEEVVAGRIMTGDSYCSERGIERIDLLKIDVEGSDHLVLAGFNAMLEGHAVDVVQFEYGMANIVSRFLLEDYYRLLNGYGFVVGKLFPGYVDFRPYDRHQEDFRGPNFVAVRSDRQDLITRLSPIGLH